MNTKNYQDDTRTSGVGQRLITRSAMVFDLDNTITNHEPNTSYSEMKPNIKLIEKLNDYYDEGYHIIIYTARNMRTFKGNLTQIGLQTVPTIERWLEKHNVKYNELIWGKPWCGDNFYVDDRAVRPSEFLSHTRDELFELLRNE